MAKMKPTTDIADLESRLQDYADGHKLRVSSERRLLLRYIYEQHKPVQPAEIEEIAAAEHISRATVYNTLKLFVRANILRHVYAEGNGRQVRYELVDVRHNRMEMRCLRCGRVVKLQDAAISDLIAAKRYSNLNYSHYTLCVYGECKLCRKAKRKKE
jgi:Fur family peroxide stress response transcriptional regulator